MHKKVFILFLAFLFQGCSSVSTNEKYIENNIKYKRDIIDKYSDNFFSEYNFAKRSLDYNEKGLNVIHCQEIYSEKINCLSFNINNFKQDTFGTFEFNNYSLIVNEKKEIINLNYLVLFSSFEEFLIEDNTILMPKNITNNVNLRFSSKTKSYYDINENSSGKNGFFVFIIE